MTFINMKKIIHWSPRILGIAFVLFLSIFSFDVFLEYNGWSAILPFLIHLVPSFILLAVVIIAWKYDLVGAVVFFGFAIFYIFEIGFYRHWSWYVGILFPAIIIGALFLSSWLWKRKK